MKISKLFHWLYASLMLLPLVVAPIFAIYSHRHTIDSYSAQVQEPSHYTLSQCVINGAPEPFNNSTTFLHDWTVDGRAEITYEPPYISCLALSGFINFSCQVDMNISSQDKIYTQVTCYADDELVSYIDVYYDELEVSLNSTPQTFNIIATASEDNNNGISYSFTLSDEIYLYICNVQSFNLTSIFGSGNEPTLSEFESLLTQDYYDFGVDYDIVYGTHLVTYNYSDIGSQFIYQLYNVEKNYFNFTSVFGLNGFGNWLYQNWFSSASYIGFYLFYYLFTYWLVISICWLLFDLLMYVPNLAHRWLDKGALE